MRRNVLISLFVLVAVVVIYLSSCVHSSQLQVVVDGNYPPAIGNIIINKCAVSGCHDSKSYQNANGLLLDTWDHLFAGGDNGAMVVAYSPQYSPLLYATNTDSTLGLVLKPTMPYSTSGRTMSPLSRSEYLTLYNWIAAGAPDKNGNVPFASNPDTRQKIYLTQSGSDLMAVIDGKSKMVMRYFSIGADSGQIENAHEVEFSSDGNYAFVCFYNGSYVQKIDVASDRVISGVNMFDVTQKAAGGWSIVDVSPEDTNVAVTNYLANSMGIINATNMTISQSNYVDGGSYLSYAHGITHVPTFDTFLITLQYGNMIRKFGPHTKPHPFLKAVSLDGQAPRITDTGDKTSPNPHQIEMLPDNSRYFVACQGTNDVRVMDAYADTLIKVIPVGTYPQEMTLCESKNYLFVTCMQDVNANTLPGRLGSVYVIDYNTYQVVKVLNGNFYQPHDMCVDEQDGYIFIASTNSNPNGIPIHHPIPGGGRPGWYSVYDLNTLQPADSRQYEVLVFPYAMNARF